MHYPNGRTQSAFNGEFILASDLKALVFRRFEESNRSFVSMEGQRRSFVRRMLRLRCNEWKKDGTGIAVVRKLVRNVIKWEVNIGNSDRA